MHQVKTLSYQTRDSYQWFNKLLKSIPEDKWQEIPANLDTHLVWQVGHLILSINFHTIMVIEGHPKELYQKMPIRTYQQLFVSANPAASVGKVAPDNIFTHLKLMQEKSLATIDGLSNEQLKEPLAPTEVPHPIAKTKFESLDWNIKHTMWHCGQLSMLKRIVDKRYDFGLEES